MSDADCIPGREPRSVAASINLFLSTVLLNRNLKKIKISLHLVQHNTMQSGVAAATRLSSTMFTQLAVFQVNLV